MNGNQLPIVKDFEIIKPDMHKTDCIFDKLITDWHNKYYHTYEYRRVYDNKITNNTNNEIFNLTISDKNRNFYKSSEKLNDENVLFLIK